MLSQNSKNAISYELILKTTLSRSRTVNLFFKQGFLLYHGFHQSKEIVKLIFISMQQKARHFCINVNQKKQEQI